MNERTYGWSSQSGYYHRHSGTWMKSICGRKLTNATSFRSQVPSNLQPCHTCFPKPKPEPKKQAP